MPGTMLHTRNAIENKADKDFVPAKLTFRGFLFMIFPQRNAQRGLTKDPGRLSAPPGWATRVPSGILEGKRPCFPSLGHRAFPLPGQPHDWVLAHRIWAEWPEWLPSLPIKPSCMGPSCPCLRLAALNGEDFLGNLKISNAQKSIITRQKDLDLLLGRKAA